MSMHEIEDMVEGAVRVLDRRASAGWPNCPTSLRPQQRSVRRVS